MTASEQQRPRPPVWRWRAVCVLGLLAGLLGMHGLAPGGGLPSAHSAHSVTRHDTHALSLSPAAPTHAGCEGGHCGHLGHADATCASGAVGDGPALPAPVADPVPVVPVPGVARAHPADAPDGARAPPTLAELQLLRI
ncbi:DUF6153 family protein [Streptomyces sp. NPDC003717]|uniref:DUF6153 family protein n=1 Tax=Streptomyces sp. NPDC003717 TaxID=3154276 RepID=UPI0033BDD70F